MIKIKPSDLRKDLLSRKRDLEYVIDNSRKNLKSVPLGTLHTVTRNKGTSYQYYLCESGNSNKRRYLKKEKMSLIGDMAQNMYYEEIIKNASEELKYINLFLSKVNDDSLLKAYANLSSGEQILINSYLVDDETYLKKWEEKSYEGKNFKEDSPIFTTEKNEKVRSKSEVMIADSLYKMGIPYKYECPLVLKNKITVYPDFTILNVHKREVLYWEHLGMMDDPEYIRSAVWKINSYEDSGLFAGKELILSRETIHNPLTPQKIKSIIEKYIL